MSDLTVFERIKLEKLLGMDDCYVLNFSDRTYTDFFIDYRVEIDAAQYHTGGGSKAKRMHTFWSVAPNHTVSRVVEGLIAYGIEESCLGDSNPELINACRLIAQRLLADQPVAELDRLHTFVIKFIRIAACDPHGIEVNRDKALHSIFGEYVKALREGMAQR